MSEWGVVCFVFFVWGIDHSEVGPPSPSISATGDDLGPNRLFRPVGVGISTSATSEPKSNLLLAF
jgi:hypothetical protein